MSTVVQVIVRPPGYYNSVEIKNLYESNADTNAFTDAEKAKLAILEDKFLGSFTSLGALQTAHPTSTVGHYADVDSGPGVDAERYIWDIDEGWVKAVGTVAGETAASIKTKYESNADTNAFTDAEKAKVTLINTTNAGPGDTIIPFKNGSQVNGMVFWNNGVLQSDSKVRRDNTGSLFLGGGGFDGQVQLINDEGSTQITLKAQGDDSVLQHHATGVLNLFAPSGTIELNAVSTTIDSPLHINGEITATLPGQTGWDFTITSQGSNSHVISGGNSLILDHGNIYSSSTFGVGYGSANKTFTIGSQSAIGARFGVVGGGSDGNTTNTLLRNLSGTNLVTVYNDGVLQVGNFTRGGGIDGAADGIITNKEIWAGAGINLNAPTVGHNPFDGFKLASGRVEVWRSSARFLSFGGNGNSTDDSINFSGNNNPSNSSTNKNFIHINAALRSPDTYSGHFIGLRINYDQTGNLSTGNIYGIYQDQTNVLNYFGGKVGIGKANPQEALDISGNFRATLSGQTGYDFQINPYGSDSHAITGGNVLQLQYLQVTASYDFFTAYSSTTRGLFVGTTSNIGAKLGVQGGGSDENSTNTLLRNSSSTELFKVKNDGSQEIGGTRSFNNVTNHSHIRINPSITDSTAANNAIFDLLKIDYTRFQNGVSGYHNADISITPTFNGLDSRDFTGRYSGLYFKPIFNSPIRNARAHGVYLDTPASNNTGWTEYFPIYAVSGISYFGGTMRAPNIPTSRPSTVGDFYLDTAANIEANGDLVVGIRQ